MGTGKTASGEALARKLKRRFVDLDELIELKEKRKICDIFAEKGEPYFRSLEKRVLKEVSREKGFVVACGGGIVMDKQNIRLMKETGIVICLAASIDAIWERVSNESHRPLLNVRRPREQMELLLKLRAGFYALADETIDTSSLSVKEVADKIEKAVLKKR